uniref:Sushi domain-containing protein n=1 Tax=Catharus ustulatus TaxID=91951 RepID=A0A8C3TRF2_CATUS
MSIKCSALTAPKMGQAACSHLHGEFTFGSTCAFSCQKGFVLMGPESRECTFIPWLASPHLAPPSRGQLSCSHMHGNFTYNSTCTFSCEEGFVQMGAELLHCEATGNWSRDAPVCAGTAGPPSSSSTAELPALLQAHPECGGGGLPGAAKSCQLSNVWLWGLVSEDGAFLKQVLAYSSGSALAVGGVVLSGGLIALLAKRLSDRGTEIPLCLPCSDLGAPGTFTNTAYDANL